MKMEMPFIFRAAELVIQAVCPVIIVYVVALQVFGIRLWPLTRRKVGLGTIEPGIASTSVREQFDAVHGTIELSDGERDGWTYHEYSGQATPTYGTYQERGRDLDRRDFKLRESPKSDTI